MKLFMENLQKKIARLTSLLLFISIAEVGAQSAAKGDPFELKYLVTLDPKNGGARVNLIIDKGELVKKLDFRNPHNIYTDIKASGKLVIKDGKVFWQLPSGRAQLSFFVKLNHERNPGKFDSIINANWAIFRGDDLVPAMHIDTGDVIGSYAVATMEMTLPEGWDHVETGWPRKKNNLFRIENPERRFDRPTGWMIAGNIGTRRAKVAQTAIAVSAPKNAGFQRMDALTFLHFMWPEVHQAFKNTPDKLLIVGAGDPMWRGGLSAANSIFLHTDRPMVSENGTSPLLHELTHMVTRISGASIANQNDDWIAEGLAEFYSFELLYRAHGITKKRRAKIIKGLEEWSADVKHLRKSNSTAQITARAVLLFEELDKEIRQRSQNKYNIDNVTQKLMQRREVSLDDLRNICEDLVGKNVKALNSPLLN